VRRYNTVVFSNEDDVDDGRYKFMDTLSIRSSWHTLNGLAVANATISSVPLLTRYVECAVVVDWRDGESSSLV